jgi:hypothetical protein
MKAFDVVGTEQTTDGNSAKTPLRYRGSGARHMSDAFPSKNIVDTNARLMSVKNLIELGLDVTNTASRQVLSVKVTPLK